jgi:predicted nucleotidyltransferase
MKPNYPSPFQDLNAVLQELTVSVQAILAENLMGLYLQGSFAVGDFDEHSDVDFLAIIKHELTEAELAALQAMHQRLFALTITWAQHLEGSYFPVEMLSRYDRVQDRPFYLDNGSQELIRSDHDNTWVVRWTVREHGIPLLGPPPDDLIAPIPPEAMHQEIIKTMHDWAEEIFSGGFQLDSLWAQPFGVISYCRMLQTLRNGRIKSKRAGVIWAQNNLPQRWQPLIQQAWQERPNPWEKVYQPINPEATAEAHAFIRYALTLTDDAKM